MIRRIVELSGPLAVDQKTREGATLRLAQELSDPVGSLEVGHEDVEQLDTGGTPDATSTRAEPNPRDFCSIATSARHALPLDHAPHKAA